VAWVVGRRVVPVVDPATGEVIASVADAAEEEARLALEVAAAAAPGWGVTPPRERSMILTRAYDRMPQREAGPP